MKKIIYGMINFHYKILGTFPIIVNVYFKHYVNTSSAWKVSKYGVFSGPNPAKYGPEKTLHLDTLHVVVYLKMFIKESQIIKV